MLKEYALPGSVRQPDRTKVVEDLIHYIWDALDDREYGRLHRDYLKRQNEQFEMRHPVTGLRLRVELHGPRARVPEGTLGPDYHQLIFHILEEL